MADTGFIAISSASQTGTGATWSNLANLYAAENSYATATVAKSTATKMIYFYFEGKPDGTINGVEVSVEGKVSSQTEGFTFGLLDENLGSIGTPTSSTSSFSTTEAAVIAGGSTNKFGYLSWAALEAANAVSFRIACPANTSGATISLDQIRLRWYYTAASSSIKTVIGLAKASVKVVNGLAIASIKGIDSLT